MVLRVLPFASPPRELCPGSASWSPSPCGAHGRSRTGGLVGRVAAQSERVSCQRTLVAPGRGGHCTVSALGAQPAGLCQALGSAPPGTRLENPAERPQRACARGGERMACGSGRTRAGVLLGARGLWFVQREDARPGVPPASPPLLLGARGDLATWTPGLQRCGALGQRGPAREGRCAWRCG